MGKPPGRRVDIACAPGDNKNRGVAGLVETIIVAALLFELYMSLPLGIPILTSPSPIPATFYAFYYAMRLFVGFFLFSVLGYHLYDAIAIAGFWLTSAVFVVLDKLYNIQL
ncbi:MAG: hypothetical protein R3F54_12315 [Alphaproteobacteria bacterium]